MLFTHATHSTAAHNNATHSTSMHNNARATNTQRKSQHSNAMHTLRTAQHSSDQQRNIHSYAQQHNEQQRNTQHTQATCYDAYKSTPSRNSENSHSRSLNQMLCTVIQQHHWDQQTEIMELTSYAEKSQTCTMNVYMRIRHSTEGCDRKISDVHHECVYEVKAFY
jgi:hypothetical protein